jgi:hypothetical protein
MVERAVRAWFSAFSRSSAAAVSKARALAVLALVLAWAACSSKAATGSKCDPSQCAAHNQCIDDGSGAGPSCHLVCTQQTDCPFGYYCNDGLPTSWCVANTLVFPGGPKQWGTHCNPPQEGGNPACDSPNGFSCYGTSVGDANGFCTQFGCLADSDCAGGYWCATVNSAPNITTNTPAFGHPPPRQVCLPRRYCDPCQLDHDCPPTLDGQPQYCTPDSQGNLYCAPHCETNGNCHPDAKCAPHWKLCIGASNTQACARDEDCPPSAQDVAQHCDFTQTADGGVATSGVCAPECGSNADCDASTQCMNSHTNFCTPRAGVCKGDGSLCSPCRSDNDCKTGGLCLQAESSPELFCSVPCGAGPTCPSAMGEPGLAIGCTGAPTLPVEPPANQCIGEVMAGGTPFLGCWSVHQ